MIEIRALTKDEMGQLLSEASPIETHGLTTEVWNYIIDNYGVENSGIVVKGHPIYAATLLNVDGVYEFDTIVNRNVKEQFTLFREAKRKSDEWMYKYKRLSATMPVTLTKNIEWTKRLGFRETQRNNNTVTLIKEKNNGMCE